MAINMAESFEYGVTVDSKAGKVLYDENSVMKYRVETLETLLEKPLMLGEMVKHHLTYHVPRLKMLEEYYLSNNPIIMSGPRRQETNKSDHRIRHGWASIISDFLNAYVLSNPIKAISEQEAFLEVVADFDKINDIDSHNSEIGRDQNNFGRAFELLQRTGEDNDRIYKLDPTEVFMIYDNTVRARVLAACRYYPVIEWSGLPERKYAIELYTPLKIYNFKPNNIGADLNLKLESESDHYFGGVPIIEYRSDRYRMSVFEKQLPLIDAYDSAQSDTANYMTDFNDSILALEGRIENADDAEYIKKMKDANILILIPEDGDGAAGPIKAHYLTKSYDVAGVEAYKTRLKQDIFNTASTPDLSDDSFGGQQSGEALKYKMFGLQQKRNDKEKFFAKGLRVRYKLLENLKRQVREYNGDAADLDFIFTPNLPKAHLEELKAFTDSGGTLSQKTKLGLLSFVTDADQEIEELKAEQGAGFNFEIRTGEDGSGS